ncbi:MAG: flagellar hook-basal body protein [Humidesulfovibrio sp.]|nr:flagellar hook-basal body protein [Humidesulfovibrio sp.]
MRESMYSALFGAMSNEHRLDVIANNLANVSTNGYKKDSYSFQDTFQRFAHDYLVDAKPFVRDKDIWPKPYIQARVRLGGQYSDMSQGSMQVTGNPKDLALVGECFYKVSTPKCENQTRNGRIQISSEGTLVTEQGYEVLGGGSAITLPRDNTIKIDSKGAITVDGNQIGTIDLVDVSDPKGVEKVGRNLYQIRKGSKATEIPPENIQVQQGYLEKSNVEIVGEMVNMMEAQRAFEINQKLMTTTDTMESLVINKVGSVG